MKRIKNNIIMLLIVAMTVSSFSGSVVKASNIYDESTKIIFTEKVTDIIGVPGETVHVKLPVKATNAYIQDPSISVDTTDMQFSVENITYTADGYSAANPPAGISNYATTYIEFDLKVKETAKISSKKLIVKVEYTAFDLESNTMKTNTLNLPNVNFVIQSEKEPAQLTIDSVSFKNGTVGNSAELYFTIKNEGEISSYNTMFQVSGYEAAGLVPGYTKLKQEAGKDGKLAAGEDYRVKLPLKTSSGATPGTKTLTIITDYKDLDGTKYTEETKVYINVGESEAAPNIEIESTKYAGELKNGNQFNLVTTLRNTGIEDADQIEVSLEGLGISSFLPNYTTDTIEAGLLEKGEKADVKIPLIVSKEAASGIKEVTIKVNYRDASGVLYTKTSKLFLEVVSADGISAEGKPNIVISNVNQSPQEPNAGARLDVFFDLVNKSKTNITEIKINPVNLNANNFSPVDSEPYQYIEKLGGGKKARITLPLKVSKTIPEGMNTLEIQYQYKDEDGKQWSDNAILYVLDVQNSGSASSKPKLIISDFKTDVDELRAGSTFNFNFDIYNTHSAVDAKNIKVTISQADNIFAITKGSNTFYITEIPAGQKSENSIELKVKADATTKAYPLEIKFEYEYEGAEINPTTGEIGETVTETINLQAIENSRPVVENVFVGNYGVPVINQPTALTFEFYNMGKSTLNNVYATVEGDFILSTGTMYFIGNVDAGLSEFAEMEVIPSVEGPAKGTLVITFEDSNGDEVKVTKDFEANIQGEFIPQDTGDGMGGQFPIETPVKKPIMPTFLFVLLQIILFAAGIPTTRKIIIHLYKRKLKKLEDAKLSE